MNEQQLYLIRGLPGSGKTTLARAMLREGAASFHYEADHYFELDGPYNFNPRYLKEAHKWCLNQTRDRLATGESVVVSNTFTEAWEVRPYYEVARKLSVEVTLIHTTNEYKSIHDVPEETIEKMRKRFQTNEQILEEMKDV